MEPVDFAHLARQTGGNKDLEREVLGLFADGIPDDLARLKMAVGVDRQAAAHLIVGSARAIGAGEVARLAAAIEGGAGDISALEAAVEVARRHIAGHLEASKNDRP